ncbi:MAG: hypothetical protein K2L88_04330, partial [Clostridiales bacterium]|nr:hypothetical protein [Clostridiales bacterium]
TPSENGIALLFIEPDAAVLAADSTVTTLVTVTPDVPSVQCTIAWSIAFNNPNSTWATGKDVTTYATVTPTEPGALTANVDVKKPFGEQIIVTAALADNADVNVKCTVDYVKRYYIGDPEDWTYNMGSVVYDFLDSNNEQVFGKKGSSVEISPITSVGTIDEDYEITINITPNGLMSRFLDRFTYNNGGYEDINFSCLKQLWSATSTTLDSGNALLKVPFEGIQGQSNLMLAPVVEFTASAEVYMFRFLHLGLTIDSLGVPFEIYNQAFYQQALANQLTKIRTAFHTTAAESEFNKCIEFIDKTSGYYVFKNFFDINVSLVSEHSSDSKKISSEFHIAINIPTASSLEIDPPSIII